MAEPKNKPAAAPVRQAPPPVSPHQPVRIPSAPVPEDAEIAEPVPTLPIGGHPAAINLPQDPIEHAARLVEERKPVAPRAVEAPTLTVDDVARALAQARPTPIPTLRLDQSVPGGLLIVNGYYVKSDGSFADAEGNPSDVPVKAPIREE